MQKFKIGVFAAVVIATSGFVAHAADYYEGKTLTVVINYPPGGSSDIEGRLVARHLGQHISGKPNVIVQNMGGAGGLIGANWLGEVAKPDGMTLGYFTATPVKAALGDPALRVDPTKFTFVAGAPGMQVTFIRSDTPPGIKTPADIMKAKDFWIGGFTPDSLKDLLERLQLDLLGVKYKYVSAYTGSAEARLAMQRNEIQLFSEGVATYRSSIESDLVKTGQVSPLWYDPRDDGKAMHTQPDAEGIPVLPFDQFLKQQKGEIPQGQMWVCESTHAITPWSFNSGVIGTRVPLLHSAGGRAYLAWCTEGERAMMLQLLQARGGVDAQMAHDAGAIRRIVKQVKQCGYALSERRDDINLKNSAEFASARCDAIAMPILRGGVAIASINLVFLARATSTEEVVRRHLPELQATAKRIGEALDAAATSPICFDVSLRSSTTTGAETANASKD